jgi:phage-related minor tail protein
VSRFAGDRVPTGEVAVTTRNVNKQASALAKARGHRRELDKSRDEQDRRVEQATATALVALGARKAAELSLREATEGLADALRRLVSQDVSIERAAALLELDAKRSGA